MTLLRRLRRQRNTTGKMRKHQPDDKKGLKMANTSHSHHRHDRDSREYVSNWAKGQEPKEKDRQEPFRVLADTIPFNKELPIRILDLGAGYGALTKFLLERFPKATAICQDGSDEMAKLGRERMNNLAGRFNYVFCDFVRLGWTEEITVSFETIVSSIAIHNVGEPKIIKRIYEDIFPLVKPDGCFLNFDRMHPPLEDQLKWLRGAGFKNVNCFWRSDRSAVFGGFAR